MFRAQQNAFDAVVGKATDENLTSENWEYILDVCDKVSAEDTGAKDVVAALIKRLAHRNANVQLYTLELANALSQNCGVKVHKELASRSFTEALLRLAGDRNTHQQVKSKILERMEEWAEMFSSDPDLGIMEQAYMRLKTQNPNLHPPSKPVKTLITDADRRREEEELQMALALSVKDRATASTAASTATSQPQSSYQPESSQAPQLEPQPTHQGTTAATVSRVRALYDFQPSEPGELAFRKGDVIAVLESVFKDWWKGSLRGQTGIFPLNYVEKLQDPTREELEREAHMESEVFAEMKNVEKLLALLSTSSEPGRGDVRDNEEITTLYHSTLAIRPKLIELIGKYSQKKDDFTQLNEKFIKARRDYENLLEASMSQPPQPTYGRPAYTYGGAPTTAQAPGYSVGGAYPAQAPNPEGRYFSPAPQEPNYPPQNAPQPFYFVPPSQQAQGQPPRPSSNTNASSDDLYANPPSRTNTDSARPQTMYDTIPAAGGLSAPGAAAPAAGLGLPQELASGSFDSPIDNRHSYAAPPSQQYGGAPPAQTSQPWRPYGDPAANPGPAPHSPSSQYSTQAPSAIGALPSQKPSHPPGASDPFSDPYSQARPGQAQVRPPTGSPGAESPNAKPSGPYTAYQQLPPSQGQPQPQAPGYQAYAPAGGAPGRWNGVQAGAGRDEEQYYR
ncbi:hypothetical protein EJ06DRAFT_583330 [Trichodelitschia bisporula]|uniref:Class E vacuolar protein-sorting machinery protein HSE1 n=1 Tax=Trichodelitschia bisporula TaxID=703511 RepID=A0A6G1HSF0_9PEZI|nr:hypothetical protein EJ06DRAFT_583330 [Trichodelitschia bisporula]